MVEQDVEVMNEEEEKRRESLEEYLGTLSLNQFRR